MPECKDIINYIISFFGIVVTGIFSFLVWKAAQKSNEIAKANYKLSESIIKSQENLNKAVKIECLKTVLHTAIEIKSVLTSHSENLLTKKVIELPKNSGLSKEQTAEFLDISVKDKINEAWNSLENYISNNLLDHYGRVKGTLYSDEVERIQKNTSIPIEKFQELIEIIDKAIESMEKQ